MTDIPDTNEILDATELDYCPYHGEELIADAFPPECPSCGPVAIDFWRTGE